MAKKKSAAGDVSVSAAIRDALSSNPKLSGKECRDVVLAKHPGLSIKEKSFQVAYSVARGKLGLGKKKRKKVKRKKPVARKPVAAVRVDIGQLKAAREFVAKMGGAKNAVAAIDQLKALQIQ